MPVRRTTSKKKQQGLHLSLKIQGGEIKITPRQILAGFVAAAGFFGMHGASAANEADKKPTAAPQAIVQQVAAPQAPSSPTIVIVYAGNNNQITSKTVDSAVAVATRPVQRAKADTALKLTK